MLSNPEALKRTRQEKGHTQSSLSRASDVAQTRISRYEDKPTPIRPTTAKKLADALGVAIADITLTDEPAEVAS